MTNSIEKVKSLQIIDALRFGIVPFHHIKSLTMGYDNLQHLAVKYLNHIKAGNQSLVSFTGQYGSGKSHMMSLIRQISWDNNFITVKAEIDGKDISFSKPELLWNIMMGSVQFQTPEVEISPVYFLDRIIEKNPENLNNYFLRDIPIYNLLNEYNMIRKYKLKDKYQGSINSILVHDDIDKAKKIQDTLKKDFGNLNRRYYPSIQPVFRWSPADGRSIDFINAIWSLSNIIKSCGYSGLIITLDECDVEVNLTKPARDRLVKTLTEIARFFKGETNHTKTSVGLFIATAASDPKNPDDIISKIIIGTQCGQLEPIPAPLAHDYIELTKKINKVYENGYGISIPYSEKSAIEIIKNIDRNTVITDGIVRPFIKDYISFLDMKYGPCPKNC